MSKALRTATLWLWGGFIYYLIELAWRGHSHPAMFVVGGLCFLTIGGINNMFPWEMGLLWQALIGAGAVTAIEFLSGVVLNLWLGLGIWDYSKMPLNVLGQVCLPFYFAWVFVAAFGVWLDDYLRWKLYGDERPRYQLI